MGTNESNWLFNLTALDTVTPQLSIANQSINEGPIFFLYD